MAVFFKEGEEKIRPGIYQRYSNIGETLVGARDGICAIAIQASWGPLGTVVKNAVAADLTKNYGTGKYSATYTVPAAQAMFQGGASTVYTYRMGTGGKKASLTQDTLTITAKYVGTYPIAVAIQEKVGDSGHKEVIVYANGAQAEVKTFEAISSSEAQSSSAEYDNLKSALKNSKYVEITAAPTSGNVPTITAASGQLTGGEDPNVNNESRSAAYAALEGYYYNTIALDVDDDESMSKSLVLQAYLDEAHKMGKLAIAVVGEKTSVDFEDRLEHSRAFNDEKVVYLGNGYKNAAGEAVEGALAICYTAGVIASTPSNKGITHTVVTGATELLENLTYSQYEAAILNGMLLLSMSPDGSIWYDSGIDTLTNPDPETQDDGWKKIRRTKCRFEMFDRIDRALQPKVGRINNDADGISDVIQTGTRILDAMANDEKKIFPGATMIEDPSNPAEADSAWFVIQADDIDSMEKIYLHYQFRYSQNA